MPDRDAPRESDTPASDRSMPATGEAPTAGDARTGGVQEAGARAAGPGTPEGGTVPAAGEAGAGDNDAAQDGEPGEAPAFLNRAARRARGKGGSAPHQATSRGANPPGRGPAQSRRQWGNRRSGG